MNRRSPILTLLAVLTLAGCASTRQTTSGAAAGATGGADTVRPALGAELLREVAAGYQSIPALSINGTMKATGQPVTVWIDAIIRRRDSLKIVLNGPFGIPIGAMSATSSNFLFFNTQEGEVVEGTPDRRTFSQLLMVELDYQEMVSLLRGELPRIPAEGSYTATENDGLLSFVVNGPDMREEFTIDPDDRTVRSYGRWIVRPDTTLPELAISYDNFTKLGDRRFPRRAVVDVQGGAQRISITIDKLAADIPAGRSFALDVPAGIPRRRL